MIIADKRTLFGEPARVCVRPRAHFGIFDIMRTGEGGLVPLHGQARTNLSAPPAQYRDALSDADLEIILEQDDGPSRSTTSLCRIRR